VESAFTMRGIRRTWWNRDFLSTPFWQSKRERFQTPVPNRQLPGSLMERFPADSDEKRMELLLRFVAPAGFPRNGPP
jgi:hypothetical protein